MTCIKGILDSFCHEVEAELKSKLRVFIIGSLIRRNLPQYWVFKTEMETVTFSVDSNGNASVINGGVNRRDVTIEVDHNYLSTALRTRGRPPFQPKQYKITPHTPKGKTAFDFLRKRFGL